MADKQISQLVAATTINDEDLFVMQQGGTAKKLSGQKLADFVYQSAADQIERVDEAVEQAEAAVEYLEEQKNEIAQAVASMAELGTDTTLSTPGMAADAAATGEVKDIALARFEQAEITGVPIATFNDGADNVPVKKLIVNIDPVQSGSGDPSPDNVRPITGWTGANVTRTGKNLFDKTELQTIPNAISVTQITDGFVLTQLRDGSGFQTAINVAGNFSGKRIYAKANIVNSSTNDGTLSIRFRNRDHIEIDSTKRITITSSNVSNSIIVPEGTVEIRILAYVALVSSVTGVSSTMTNVIVSLEDAQYEPYKGDKYEISFPVEAGTVYGGTLDVTNRVLTVDRAYINVDNTYDWTEGGLPTSDGTHRYYVSLSNLDAVEDHAISDKYKLRPYAHRGDSQRGEAFYIAAGSIQVSTAVAASVNDFKTWLSNNGGLNVVYELATPITYTLTSPVVRTLLALNNIWADTGNINDLIYRKMPIPEEELENTIESMITGIEHTMEATQNYTEGDLVIAVHKLYHIDSNIASGETLVPGVNCSVTTIEAELASLKTSVNNLNLAFGSLGSLATLDYQVVT